MNSRQSTKQSGIRVTVGLPMYRARKIGFLALESLARQEDVNFAWELIVIEEKEEAMGEATIREFESRLKTAGCQRILYEEAESKLALSEKWLRIARLASPDSEFLLLQAADCFSHPFRLRNTEALISLEVDWIQSPLGAFFDISTHCLRVFDYELVEPYERPFQGHDKHPTALNMAARLDLVRHAKSEEVRRGVDGWLFFSLQAAKGGPLGVVWDRSEDWKRGADTHGMNQISLTRGMMLEETEAPFREEPGLEISNLIPTPILEQLNSLQLEALQNRLQQVQSSLHDEWKARREAEEKLKNFRGMIRRRNEKISRLQSKLLQLRQNKTGSVKERLKNWKRRFPGVARGAAEEDQTQFPH